MSYPPSKIPDAPMPLSMMPSVEEIHDTEILYIVQPTNPVGQRSRSTTFEQFKAGLGNINFTKISKKTGNNIAGGMGYPHLDIPLIEVPPHYAVTSVDLDIEGQEEVSSSNWSSTFLSISCGVGTYSPGSIPPGDYQEKYPFTGDVILPPAPIPQYSGSSSISSYKPRFFCHFTPDFINQTEGAVTLRAIINWNLPGISSETHWSYKAISTAYVPRNYQIL